MCFVLLSFYNVVSLLKLTLMRHRKICALVIIGMAVSIIWGKSAFTDSEREKKEEPLTVYSNPYLKGSREERIDQVEKIAALFGVECDFCHNEDVTVFTEEGEISKKMMRASAALGVDCDHCHIDRKRYKENKEQAKRMFELCEIMGTECDFCHAGKGRLTPKGEKSKTAFLTRAWALTGTEKCLECHIEKKQFALNFYGWQVLNAMKGLKGM